MKKRSSKPKLSKLKVSNPSSTSQPLPFERKSNEEKGLKLIESKPGDILLGAAPPQPPAPIKRTSEPAAPIRRTSALKFPSGPKAHHHNPPTAVQPSGKQISFHRDIDQHGRRSTDDSPRSLIRQTLLGRQVTTTAQRQSIDSYEYINQRYTYKDDLDRVSFDEAGSLVLTVDLSDGEEEPPPTPKIGSLSSNKSRRISEHEWHILRFSSMGGGLDMEMWWRRASMKHRLTAILTAILLAITILQFIAGLIFLSVGFLEKGLIPPYVCTTPICEKSKLWLLESMNESVNPCDNFYEFMCEKYNETEEEGDLFGNMITEPVFKIEVNKASILTKILKLYNRTHKQHNQHIDFFRSCLDFPKRDDYQKQALADSFYDWFGTKDLSTFDQNTKPMENVTADIMKTIGHACFMNVAFYTYPYILITEPHPSVMKYRFAAHSDNRQFLEKVFGGLVRNLGMASGSFEELVSDMVNGTDVMSTIIDELHTAVKILPNIPDANGINKILDGNLSGLCPPMGIQLDYDKTLELFIRHDFTVVYSSPTAQKYAIALKACFSKDPSQFTKIQFIHKETAFFALIIANSFLRELIIGMDYKGIINDWGFNATSDNPFAKELYVMSKTKDEYICMDTLFSALGYLPSIRFLMTMEKNAPVFMRESEAYIRNLYSETQFAFSQIPSHELDWRLKMLGDTILGRNLHVNVGFPLVGGLLDTAAALNFSDDFLENTIAGLKHTVESARQNWMGSTDPHPSMKWFARGGPKNPKMTLHVPHFVHIDSAQLEEKVGAVKNREWEKFLGRNSDNYVLFPMALFDGEQADFTSLKHARFTVPMIQTILSTLHDAQADSKYPSLGKDDLFGGPSNGGAQPHNMTCQKLEITREMKHDYAMVSSNVSHYTWEEDSDKIFLALLSAKLAYKAFLKEEEELKKLDYNFGMPDGMRRSILQKRLPGSLSKYDEKQLFFMGYVRNICRGSWKKGGPEEHISIEDWHNHYVLETTVLHILMQMDEFADAWKCRNGTMMDNYGLPRCFHFKP